MKVYRVVERSYLSWSAPYLDGVDFDYSNEFIRYKKAREYLNERFISSKNNECGKGKIIIVNNSNNRKTFVRYTNGSDDVRFFDFFIVEVEIKI